MHKSPSLISDATMQKNALDLRDALAVEDSIARAIEVTPRATQGMRQPAKKAAPSISG